MGSQGDKSSISQTTQSCFRFNEESYSIALDKEPLIGLMTVNGHPNLLSMAGMQVSFKRKKLQHLLFRNNSFITM